MTSISSSTMAELQAERTWNACTLPEAQSGLWFAQHLDPENPSFNTGEYFVLKGSLNRELFQKSVETAFAEADCLSVQVTEGIEGPVISPVLSNIPVLEIVDFRTQESGLENARKVINSDLAKPCDLSRDQGARSILFLVDEDVNVWYTRIHHVLIDGYGFRLFADRVADLYSAGIRQSLPSTAEFGSYSKVIEHSLEYETSERRNRDRSFWLDVMDGFSPSLSITEGIPSPAHYHIETTVPVGDIVAKQLLPFAENIAVSWPDVLTAIFSAFVERHTGGGKVVVGVAAMQRLGSPAARVPTMTMNVVPCPLVIDDTLSIADFCKGVARTLRDVRRHSRYRGEQIRRDLSLIGNDRRLHGPLVNIMPFGSAVHFEGLETQHHVPAPGPVDDLTLDVRGSADGKSISIVLQANPSLYDVALLDELAIRLGDFLGRALAAESLSQVQTLTDSEFEHWTAKVNDTAAPIPESTLVDRMESTVSRIPNELALRDDKKSYSWSEWSTLTAVMAKHLSAHGVGPGKTVAIRMKRSADQVLTIAAILQAGGAWLPLDPDDPDARHAVVLDTAESCVVITDDDQIHRKANDIPVVGVSELQKLHAGLPDVKRAGPDDPAYVIFTSGSTGAPKGVVVTHRAIVNRLDWMASHYGIDETDRLLLKTPVTFDVSVWELILPVVSGASLTVAPPDAHKDPVVLSQLIRSKEITTVHFVPSMLSAFLDEPSVHGIKIKRTICSGEALSADLRDRFHSLVDSQLHNLYGPTEAAVDVTQWEAHRDDRSDPIPIGYPITNVQTWVLDRANRPVPPGVTGSLYLGGVQLALGYLGRPDLTEQAFVSGPFGRMYRTGDLAKWRRDGALIYLGREDSQVKLRGQRIEPGEIEYALKQASSVQDAVVIVREDRPGDQRLVAYVVPNDVLHFDASELRSFVSEKLPAHFVPSAFVAIDSFPVSRHGKLDRKRLPAPALSTDPNSGKQLSGAEEEMVARQFARVLGMDNGVMPSADDDFFLLGGHSLLAVRLVHGFRNEGVEIALGTIFANPTVSGLAKQIQRAGEGRQAGTERDGLDLFFRFSAENKADIPKLFCIHPAGGISWCYRPLARHMSGSMEVIGLQARGLLPEAKLPSTLSDLASDYIGEIRQVQPLGPIHLLGWSIGGVIAHEMAVQLEQAGQLLGGVTMLDAFPADRWRSSAEPDEASALKAMLLIAGIEPDAVPLNERDSRAGVMKLLSRMRHPLAAVSMTTFDGILRSVLHNNRLVREHHHQVLNSDVLYLRASREHEHDGISALEWEPYMSGSLKLINVDVRHSEMAGDNVSRQLAILLKDRIEGKGK